MDTAFCRTALALRAIPSAATLRRTCPAGRLEGSIIDMIGDDVAPGRRPAPREAQP